MFVCDGHDFCVGWAVVVAGAVGSGAVGAIGVVVCSSVALAEAEEDEAAGESGEDGEAPDGAAYDWADGCARGDGCCGGAEAGDDG